MKVALTGWNGFLSRKLRENKDIQWQQELHDSDILFLMGSPTFTNFEIDREQSKKIHDYVKDTIKIIDNYTKPIIFASTTGVNDIDLNHLGTTSYNLSKLYIENYLFNNCKNFMILRIGTVISDKLEDILNMKEDRIQQRILKNNFSNIEFEDNYLFIQEFVNTTIKNILNFKTGIVEYKLTKITLPKLILLGK